MHKRWTQRLKFDQNLSVFVPSKHPKACPKWHVPSHGSHTWTVRHGEFVKSNLDQHVGDLRLQFSCWTLTLLYLTLMDKNSLWTGRVKIHQIGTTLCDLVLRFLQQSWFNGNWWKWLHDEKSFALISMIRGENSFRSYSSSQQDKR